MKRWIISDTHCYHQILCEICGWPSNFTEIIIKNLIQCVGPKDTLYHLGDVHFGTIQQLKDIMEQIPGHKILIKGNHDKLTDTKYLECGFDFVCDGLMIDKTILTHQRVYTYQIPIGGINIHGHSHKMYRKGIYEDKDRKYIVYTPDAYNFAPVELNKLLAGKRYGKR
jgi:calcineurin-like phosphoesterase family protein